jgi:oligopeptide/dipeptide ABC transporter ATP-binding protein
MLKLDRISKVYKVGILGGTDFSAVRDVSFTVEPGEVVSLIGESGSGKTTIGKMVLRLVPITTGQISVDGVDISTLKRSAVKGYYQDVQGVFQDPFSSHNPIFRVDHVFSMIHDQYFHGLKKREWKTKLESSLGTVGLDAATLHKFPHQLSGGQLQRLLIARALLLNIKFLVADEVISMLDASTRIDVLNPLGELKARGLGILFITHDLSLGNYISDRTIILNRGVVVEMGATDKVFGNPLHPYTRMLVSSVPKLHQKWAEVDLELKAKKARAPDRCLYHAAYPIDEGQVGSNGDRPNLVEAEDDHFVGLLPAGGCGHLLICAKPPGAPKDCAI